MDQISPATTRGTERATGMPEAFLTWQCEERRRMFKALLAQEQPAFWQAHLPVVSTSNGPDSLFPIHSSNKGVGLFPREEYLHKYLTAIEECLERTAERPPAETLEDRIQTALSLYERPEEIDPRGLCSLEIFRGNSFKNMSRDSRATLLFTGSSPTYLSYQLNCGVEVVEPTDARYRFVLGMRFLFEMERFHIQQPDYPLAYLFWVREVFEKTPRMGVAGRRVTSSGGGAGCPMGHSRRGSP